MKGAKELANSITGIELQGISPTKSRSNMVH